MVWIFVQCSEYQGQCIRYQILRYRSYIAFGAAIVVCAFSLMACLMHYRQKKMITFEQLPLTINLVTSLSLVVIYSQKQMFNIRLILLLIEFYSYFLLSFGFIFNVLRKSIKAIKYQTFRNQTKKAWLIFGLVTGITGFMIILLIVLAAFNTVNCFFDQQVGSIIVLALQIPLTVITFILISKAKVALASVFHNTSSHIAENTAEKTQFSQMTEHLLNGEDQNKRLNYRQTDLVRFGLVFSVILHITELTCVLINNNEDQIFCNPNNNRIEVVGPLGLATVSIETVSELFPHIIIPIIFWFLVIKPRLASETLYVFLILVSQQNNPTRIALEAVSTKIQMHQTFLISRTKSEVSRISEKRCSKVGYRQTRILDFYFSSTHLQIQNDQSPLRHLQEKVWSDFNMVASWYSWLFFDDNLQLIMHSNNSVIEFTFSKNRTPPISSFATERETNQSFMDLHPLPLKNYNNQNKSILHPQFLSLINNHSKKEWEQNHQESETIPKDQYNPLAFFDNLCRCVEIEKDVPRKNQIISEAPRMDLRHLLVKNKQSELIKSQKRTLTPINSLVNLLDQRK